MFFCTNTKKSHKPWTEKHFAMVKYLRWVVEGNWLHGHIHMFLPVFNAVFYSKESELHKPPDSCYYNLHFRFKVEWP